ncbi:hypothetical protein GC197_14625 [bacterium]|nr:hypothetical protein [bacterium]
MTQLTQVFLKPGRYSIGGQMKEFTARHLADLSLNTRRLLAAGIRIPLWSAHKPAGSVEGGPRIEAMAATDNLGWMTDVRQLPDGSLEQTLEVLDEQAAAGIASGRIQFTSPEIGPYIDGLGRAFGQVIRHMALTATPRNPEQGSFQPILQFSLEDRIEEPSMPQTTDTNSPSPESQIVDAIAELGGELPLDWTADEEGLMLLLDNLWAITEGELEEQPPIQFSEEAQATIDRLQAQLDQGHRAALSSRFAKLPLPLKQFCETKLETIQFSETGSAEPNVSLSEVADLFRQVLPNSMQFGHDDLQEVPPSTRLLGEEDSEESDNLTNAVLKSIGLSC